ncbi:unnamed protein product [Lasius platythorax]|uniref:Uncharacterized protein n=1 Tax=Lasius platythorax TaxID=488582 RepID=A0AAV2NMB2_9HYME
MIKVSRRACLQVFVPCDTSRAQSPRTFTVKYVVYVMQSGAKVEDAAREKEGRARRCASAIRRGGYSSGGESHG